MRIVSILLFLCLLFPAMNRAADGQALYDAFQEIYSSRLDEAAHFRIKGAEISHRDFSLKLNNGAIYFAEPISLDDSKIIYGAFFDGDGEYTIAPTEIRAREQIEHEFKEPSVSKRIERALLVFTPDIYRQLKTSFRPGGGEPEKGALNSFRGAWEQFSKKENYYFSFEILRNIYEPSDQPFLFVNVQESGLSLSEYYLYNPLDAEEIKVYKNKITGPMFEQTMKTLCSYSCLLDSTGTKCRIVSEPQVKTLHNAMDIDISDLGDLTAVVTTSYKVLKPPAQLLWMLLHEDMLVDSIIDRRGEAVHFVRHTDASNKSSNLYLFLNSPAQTGDTIALTYYYHGKILDFGGHDIVNVSGFDWYPAYVERDAAMATITYAVPFFGDLTFESTGNLIEQSLEGHTQTSTWGVTDPEIYLYFDYKPK